ncbi:MAG: fumarylacetoacetate hydrolase family protein [Rhodoferax sp.]|nr:fumarylacetoacetate hydrolase family protein [Rhodoferax sp.]
MPSVAGVLTLPSLPPVPSLPAFDRAPYRLSGVVYGTLLNHTLALQAVLYRPSLRFRVRDGFCSIGPVVAQSAIANPDNLAVQVFVDGESKQTSSTSQRIRNVAQLLADVTEFMTLYAGDILMLGAAADAPRVRAGQHTRITMEGIGELVNHFVPEEALA